MNMFSQLTGVDMNLDELLRTTAEIKQHKDPIVIYHGNCADGFAAAWCFWKIQEEWETAFNFYPGVYNEPPPDCADAIVYLVDFSYKRDVVEEIINVASEVYLIDHHKTALEDLACFYDKTHSGYEPRFEKFHAYTDLNRSGAMLAWDFLNNYKDTGKEMTTVTEGSDYYVKPPLLLQHIQDRDLWKFELPLTREIQANLFSYPYDFKIWDDLMGMTELELKDFAKQGEAIERKHHKDIAELVGVCCRIITILDYDVPVASLPYTMSSDAAHLMAKEHLGGKSFAACYIDTATHRVFSLRSTNDGIDVSEVAKRFNGGGHRNAAGFRVERSHPLAMV